MKVSGIPEKALVVLAEKDLTGGLIPGDIFVGILGLNAKGLVVLNPGPVLPFEKSDHPAGAPDPISNVGILHAREIDISGFLEVVIVRFAEDISEKGIAVRFGFDPLRR